MGLQFPTCGTIATLRFNATAIMHPNARMAMEPLYDTITSESSSVNKCSYQQAWSIGTKFPSSSQETISVQRTSSCKPLPIPRTQLTPNATLPMISPSGARSVHLECAMRPVNPTAKLKLGTKISLVTLPDPSLQPTIWRSPMLCLICCGLSQRSPSTLAVPYQRSPRTCYRHMRNSLPHACSLLQRSYSNRFGRSCPLPSGLALSTQYVLAYCCWVPKIPP